MSAIRGILADLWYQFPVGMTTYGRCATGCGTPARGGRVCKICLAQELHDLGIPSFEISELLQLHREMQRVRMALADAELRMKDFGI